MLRSIISSPCRRNLTPSTLRRISTTPHLSFSWMDKVKGVLTGQKTESSSSESAQSFTLLREWFLHPQSVYVNGYLVLYLWNANRICGGDEEGKEIRDFEAVRSWAKQWGDFCRCVWEAGGHHSIPRRRWSYWGGSFLINSSCTNSSVSWNFIEINFIWRPVVGFGHQLTNLSLMFF